MKQVIIYKQPSGVIAVIWPTAEAVEAFGIDAIARKDVPAGQRFAIIDAADIPADRSMRAAWTVDDADLNDGVGAESDAFEAEGELQ